MNRLLVLIFIVLAHNAFADAASDRASKLYDQVRCPTCISQSVKESDTIASEQIREFISRKISEGKTDDQILELIAEYYGEDLVLKPTLSLHTILLWLIPIAILFFGFVSIFKRGVKKVNSRRD